MAVTTIIEIIEQAMVGKVLMQEHCDEMVNLGRIKKVDFYGYDDVSLGVTTTQGIASIQPYDYIELIDEVQS